MAQEYYTGWIPDPLDDRDYTPASEKVQELLEGISSKVSDGATSVDLSGGFSAIAVEDQGQLGSCTAQAGVGLLEYFQRATHREHIEASKLFLYKVTRNLIGGKHRDSDKGASLRSTMKAMALIGVLPEHYYPYEIDNFNNEPSAFHYALAGNYKGITYYRHDGAKTKGSNLLEAVKESLRKGIPLMFGFTLYKHRDYPKGYSRNTGEFLYPNGDADSVGGHAVIAVGYDDNYEASNHEKGAIRIRNSWGTRWGDKGYGWVPYDYFRKGFDKDRAVRDFWSLLDAEYVSLGKFDPPVKQSS